MIGATFPELDRIDLELDTARRRPDHGIRRNRAAAHRSGKEIIMKKTLATALLGLTLTAAGMTLPAACLADSFGNSRYYLFV